MLRLVPASIVALMARILSFIRLLTVWDCSIADSWFGLNRPRATPSTMRELPGVFSMMALRLSWSFFSRATISSVDIALTVPSGICSARPSSISCLAARGLATSSGLRTALVLSFWMLIFSSSLRRARNRSRSMAFTWGEACFRSGNSTESVGLTPKVRSMVAAASASARLAFCVRARSTS